MWFTDVFIADEIFDLINTHNYSLQEKKRAFEVTPEDGKCYTYCMYTSVLWYVTGTFSLNFDFSDSA